MRLFLTSFFWICALVCGFSQVSISMQTNAKKILKGSSLSVSVIVKNANWEDYQAPDFGKSFQQLGSPSSSNRTTIVNGNSQRTNSLTYNLLALAEGSFTIQPPSIVYKGKKLVAEPIRIEVVNQSALGADANAGGEMIFIKSKLSTDTAVVGEEVELDLYLYVASEIAQVTSYNLLSSPPLSSFVKLPVQLSPQSFSRDIIDGQPFSVKLLNRKRIVPQRQGSYQIAPTIYEFLYLTHEDRKELREQSTFFPLNYSDYVRKAIGKTDTLALTVLPLPQDSTGRFSGAIGSFSLKGKVAEGPVATNEALRFFVSVVSKNDPKTIPVPDVNFPSSFKRLEPKVLGTKQVYTSGGMLNEKTFEISAIPKKAGSYSFQASLVYYAPKDKQFKTTATPLFSIDIQEGVNTIVADLPEQELTSERFEAMPTQQSKLRLLSEGNAFGITGYATVLGSLLLAFFLAILVRYLWMRRQAERASSQHLIHAYQHSLSKLKQAEKEAQDADKGRAAIETCAQAMLHFFQQVFAMPNSALSPAQIQTRLQLAGVTAETTKQYAEVVKKTERLRFAGAAGAEGLTDMIRQGKQAVEALYKEVVE